MKKNIANVGVCADPNPLAEELCPSLHILRGGLCLSATVGIGWDEDDDDGVEI